MVSYYIVYDLHMYSVEGNGREVVFLTFKSHTSNFSPYRIKTLSKLGINGSFLSLIRNIYQKPTENIIFPVEESSAKWLVTKSVYKY